jgi:hypothetical protein
MVTVKYHVITWWIWYPLKVADGDEECSDCDGNGNISCDNCDGGGKRDVHAVTVTVMLVVMIVHHQVMSSVLTVTVTEPLVRSVVVTEQQIVMNAPKLL